MVKNIFINMPVKDLNRSVEFFTKLGFAFNKDFTDESATSMIVGDNIYVMLLVEKRFLDFTKKEIADTKKCTEMILAIDAESKLAVDEFVDKALAAGGLKTDEPQDYGFMYSRSFEDLDGHHWEVLHMNAMPPAQEK
jgi:predicted lactoylglutathione lyase